MYSTSFQRGGAFLQVVQTREVDRFITKGYLFVDRTSRDRTTARPGVRTKSAEIHIVGCCF